MRAWLQGDWDVVEGSFFPSRPRLLHRPVPDNPPAGDPLARWDRGKAPPSVGWWVVCQDTFEHARGSSRGAIVRIPGVVRAKG